MRLNPDASLEVVNVADVGEDALLVHDELRESPVLASMLARLAKGPHEPTPIGVFRDVQRTVYGEAMDGQLDAAKARLGAGDLSKLLSSGDTWTVK